MPLRHERLGEADPDTLRRDVVDSLQRGELSVLPTETVYGLAVLPSQAAGVRLAQEWRQGICEQIGRHVPPTN